MKKMFLYPTYKQNFDQLFQYIKREKENWKNTIGLEELHIFLFEKDSVWEDTTFRKYQKGILFSGFLNPGYENEIKAFMNRIPYLSIDFIEISSIDMKGFLSEGTAYLIE